MKVRGLLGVNMNTYGILARITDWCGPWFLAAAARTIAVGYFLLSRRRKESCRFYGVLFPRRGRLYHLWCTLRQFQNFTTIHLDRYLANRGKAISYTVQGHEELEALLGRSGAILMMSHLGNWEMAARLLMEQRRNLNLLLLMGAKEKEGVEKTQKDELRQAGVSIIAATQQGGSPFAMVEAVRLLRDGGIVSMTGDIIWHEGQRWIPVCFLGGEARLPESPFVLAMVSGTPVYVFFALRTTTGGYRCVFSPPIVVRSAARTQRTTVLREAAQRYADLLEETLRRDPLQWYHFQRFVHLPGGKPQGAPIRPE